MKNPLHFCSNKPVLTILTGLFALVLNTASFAKSASGTIDTTSITAIEVRIANDHLDQFGFSLPIQQMIERVTNNLAQWRFPVRAAGSKAFSHTLEMSAGEIKNASTPVGFSFSSGNSDPRAAGFQKADVIPMSCRLSANDNPEQNVELEMSFSANEFIDGLKNHGDQTKIIDKLIDKLSTVCFDLLDDLKWAKPEQQGMSEPIKPTWMPQVKIETVPEPAPAEKVKTAVDTEIDNTEERKQIIIHNQGSPLILKFGHERR